MLGLSASLRELLGGDVRALDVAIINSAGAQVDSFSTPVVPPATAAITSVASAATSTSLLAANAARRRFVIYNDSTKTLRVAFGVAASATVFTVVLAAKAQYDSPLNDYTGELFGIWDSANGFARVTEISD